MKIPCEAIVVLVIIAYLYFDRKSNSGDVTKNAAIMLAAGVLICRELKKKDAKKEEYGMGCKACA